MQRKEARSAAPVATFTDDDPAGTTGDFSATIDWGDGTGLTTVTGAQITDAAGTFAVPASHAYAEEGTYAMTVTVSDSGGASDTLNPTAVIHDASLSATASAVSTTEGNTFSGPVAMFNDANASGTVADYSAIIDWGDGTGLATITGSKITDSGGTFTVPGSHVYSNEGTYTMTVTITDIGGASTTIKPVATVSDAALNATASAVSATEGSTFSGPVATFTDVDSAATTADYSATINWGDGTGLTTVAASAITDVGGMFTIPASHVFADEGTHTMTVTITDIGGATATLNPTAIVHDAALSATASAVSATAGSTFTGQVAKFTDANSTAPVTDFTATIDWGDGTSTAASVAAVSGSFVVNGSHLFTQAASRAVTIAIHDPGGASATVTSTVVVADTVVSGSAAAISPTEGATFSGNVATFSGGATNGATSDFAAKIVWGDGDTTSGSLSGSASGGFTVSGSHTYAEEGDAVPLAVVVTDLFGNPSTFTSSITVADAKLHLAAGASISPSGGAVSSLVVATLTDDGGLEPAGNYAASIDWGDGATTAGSISLVNGVFQITGNHQYAKAGSFSIGVSVKDDGGSVDALSEQAAVQLTPHQEYVVAVYHDVLGRSPDLGGLAHWTHELDAGADIGSVAEAIAHSDEYYANFVIKPDYVKLLGRTADDSGVSYWTSQMDAGATDQQLEADLVSSDEFYKTAGGTNVAWIDAVYKLLLGRTADSAGESYWSSQLAAGQTLNQVAQRIASSNENNTQLINDDYFHYLGRGADAGGLSYWLNQFAAGQTNEDVIAGFTGAAEYYKEHTG